MDDIRIMVKLTPQQKEAKRCAQRLDMAQHMVAAAYKQLNQTLEDIKELSCMELSDEEAMAVEVAEKGTDVCQDMCDTIGKISDICKLVLHSQVAEPQGDSELKEATDAMMQMLSKMKRPSAEA